MIISGVPEEFLKAGRLQLALSLLRYDSFTMRILVVEDERTMAELLKKGLEEEQHSVCVATKRPLRTR